jgi:hypothetical protein
MKRPLRFYDEGAFFNDINQSRLLWIVENFVGLTAIRERRKMLELMEQAPFLHEVDYMY